MVGWPLLKWPALLAYALARDIVTVAFLCTLCLGWIGHCFAASLANCVYTLSTRGSLLRSGAEAIAKPTLPARPAPAAFALPHVDDFDGPRADGGEALFFSDVSATSRVCRPCDDGLIGLD